MHMLQRGQYVASEADSEGTKAAMALNLEGRSTELERCEPDLIVAIKVAFASR
jgi:hypothetical protein